MYFTISASSGIGGGCYILTHNGTTLKNEFVDSREFAPKGSTSDMFEKEPLLAQDGGLAIAVFSELKGKGISRSSVVLVGYVVSTAYVQDIDFFDSRVGSYHRYIPSSHNLCYHLNQFN